MPFAREHRRLPKASRGLPPIVTGLLLLMAGCASCKPANLDAVPFRDRALFAESETCRIEVAVPSPKEAAQLFGRKPHHKDIQPVWLRIENRGPETVFFVPRGMDPDVDETRTCLLQDLLLDGGLSRFGFVKGVGPAPLTSPRRNLTGDPHFTDGFRLVVDLTNQRTDLDEVDFIDWETPSSEARGI